jgi:hypothetical protein
MMVVTRKDIIRVGRKNGWDVSFPSEVKELDDYTSCAVVVPNEIKITDKIKKDFYELGLLVYHKDDPWLRAISMNPEERAEAVKGIMSTLQELSVKWREIYR